MLHISRCVSSRQTVWHLPHVSTSFLSKVMDRKRTLLWHIVTSSGQNTFLPITFDRKEIETWGRSQFACLDETHGLICNMTYLGHLLRTYTGTVYPIVTSGVSLHVRTCTPHRCISETAWPIALKFAVWLGAYWLRAEYGMDWVETIQSSLNPRATDPNPVQSSWWSRIWIQSSPIRI